LTPETEGSAWAKHALSVFLSIFPANLNVPNCGCEIVAAKSTLNAKNLEELGAERLAELLIEISTGNAAAKRRLRLELAGAANPDDMAKEVAKRLATIARSRRFVEWHNLRVLIDDLEAQRSAIADKIANINAPMALELMWRFLALANSVYNRCDDSNGRVREVFRNARTSLGAIAQLARPSPEKLAEQIYEALQHNGYGQYEELVGLLAPSLGNEGLEYLKKKITMLSKELFARPQDKERHVVGYGPGGSIYEDEIQESTRKVMVKNVLRAIADAQGDVDAFIAQYDEKAKKVPMIAASIAQRLLASSRAEEALKIIEAAEHRGNGWVPLELEDARIDVFDAMGRAEDAQRARWRCFEKALSVEHLRSYLRRLPDFDDEEAQVKAFDHVQTLSDVHAALAFFIDWPALDRAESLVLKRSTELDGNFYELLTPAADQLAGKYPLAATVLLRAMIVYCLKNSKQTRYRHAAKHLMECSSLSVSIADYQKFENHEAFVARLEAEQARNSGFWDLLD